MAMPGPMKQMVQTDPREELQKRIQDAPIAHANAVLSAYELLQQLHDTGTLDVLRGALGAGDALVEHVVSLVTAPESINALRNVILSREGVGQHQPGSFSCRARRNSASYGAGTGHEAALAFRPGPADSLAGRAPRPGGCCKRYGSTWAGAGKGERFVTRETTRLGETKILALSHRIFCWAPSYESCLFTYREHYETVKAYIETPPSWALGQRRKL